MKKVIVGWLLKVLTVLVAASIALGPVQASAMQKPRAVKLIKSSECKIDFNESIYWTGRAEDMPEQITWLVKQLQEKCLDQKCVFTNIDHFYWKRVSSTRFFEEWKDRPDLMRVGRHVAKAMWECRGAVNPIKSKHSKGCTGNNTANVSITGNDSTATVVQKGCYNNATLVIVGDNVVATIRQHGRSTAVVKIYNSNVNFNLNQKPHSNYNQTITPGS